MRISQSVKKLQEPEMDEVLQQKHKTLSSATKQKTARIYQSFDRNMRKLQTPNDVRRDLPAKKLVKKLSLNFGKNHGK